MAIFAGTINGNAGLGPGGQKIVTVTGTMTTATDGQTFTEASHGFRSIKAILGVTVTANLSSTFSTVQAAFSGMALTLTAKNASGSAATATFGTVEVAMLVDL